jgi:hypothetical protein
MYRQVGIGWRSLYVFTIFGYVAFNFLKPSISIPEDLLFLKAGYKESLYVSLAISSVLAFVINFCHYYCVKAQKKKPSFFKIIPIVLIPFLHLAVFLMYSSSSHKNVDRYLKSLDELQKEDIGLNAGINKLISLNNTFIPLHKSLQAENAKALKIQFEEVLKTESERRSIDYADHILGSPSQL